MAADQVVDDRRAAAIGHARQRNAEHLPRVFEPSEMRNGAVARHAKRRLVGIGLEPGHKSLEVLGIDGRARPRRRTRSVPAARPARNPWLCRSSARSPPSAANTSSGRSSPGSWCRRGWAFLTDLDADQPVAAGAILDDDGCGRAAGAICCATIRHSESPPPPAANGKMILVSGRTGRTHRPLARLTTDRRIPQ